MSRERLAQINKRLNELYLGLDKFGESSPQGYTFLEEINQLEREKSNLPAELLTEEAIKKYSNSLRLSASYLYSQQNTLNALLGKTDEELTDNELKSKQRALERIEETQPKLDEARTQLQGLGLSDEAIEAIIEEGHQEQEGNIVKKLTDSVRFAVEHYIKAYYGRHQHLPDDIVASLSEWEQTSNPDTLSDEQHKLITAKNNCLDAGLLMYQVEEVIRVAQRWDEETQKKKLNSLKSTVKVHAKRKQHAGGITTRQVYSWVTQLENDEKLDGNQRNIVWQIKNLRMYGVSEGRIKSAIQNGTGEGNIITSALNRLFGG